ncbi:hypothetical protein [Noviherbaspirillum malthae]|jgi:hypothetical protein|uniref:hypothetical protein n=1 Tax=Noviherbaspirillum malthae TaxID=1260987 RepID=UPI00188E1288|nr:hypothetical protein [Noviherbaspirillum malthae]
MPSSVSKPLAAAALAALIAAPAAAKLPAPTPEQQQAAAAKKEQAAAQTEKEKKELTDSMEKIASRWRERAAANGWETHPQVSATGQAPGGAGAATAAPPIRSEKAGTAPPSTDVKDPEKKGK